MTSIQSSFATCPLATAVGIDGGGYMAQSILDRTVNMSFIQGIDHSRKMTNFIYALQLPTSKKIGKTLTPFVYTLDTKI